MTDPDDDPATEILAELIHLRRQRSGQFWFGFSCGLSLGLLGMLAVFWFLVR